MDDAALFEHLRGFDAEARRRLRRWLIQDRFTRVHLAIRARDGSPGGQFLGDPLDELNLHEQARRQFVRVLGAMAAANV